MRTNYIALLASFASLSCVPVYAETKLVNVDASAQRLTVSENGIHLFYKINPATNITFNGAPSSLDKLRVGNVVTVVFSDSQTISRIAASGLPASAQTNVQVPMGARPAPPRNIHVRVYADGSSRFNYTDGKLWIEHIGAGHPENITVNGVDWKPKWDGKISQPFTGFPITPAPVGQGRVLLKQIAGRERITLAKPTSSKFEKIPSVEVNDSPGGADNYEFVLSW